MAWFPSVAIVGAGFGGIGMGIQLKEKLGHTNFTIYEKENEVGGTWCVNTYPGCACDVAAPVYSFSFALNPNWSRKFAPASEILAYLKDVVNKFGIRQNIQFNTEIIKAEWDKDNREWQLTIKHNDKVEIVTYNILINGTGALRIPNIPEDLLADYEGDWVHTAKWNNFDVSNKNVAVIGNGASAVQLIPNIANDVDQLYVYQRTASWIMVKNEVTYGPFWKRLMSWTPLNRLYRWALFLSNEAKLRVMRRNYPLASYITRFVRRRFEQIVRTNVPVGSLRAKLTPSYEPGCKRIILSDDFHQTFLKPNVHLITEPISQISGNTIYSGDGTQTKIDALVLATGFRPDLFIAPMKIIGKEGKDVLESWTTEGPRAYYGFCCSGLPNSFFLLGPNSGLGHNSIIFIIECQIAAIVKVVKEMIEKNLASVEVKKEVEEDHNKYLQDNLKDTVWASGCKSWYYDAEKGNYTLWPHSCIEFWRQTKQIPMTNFNVVPK